MLSTANGTATSATAVPNVDTTSQASSSRKLRLASAPRTSVIAAASIPASSAPGGSRDHTFPRGAHATRRITPSPARRRGPSTRTARSRSAWTSVLLGT